MEHKKKMTEEEKRKIADELRSGKLEKDWTGVYDIQGRLEELRR